MVQIFFQTYWIDMRIDQSLMGFVKSLQLILSPLPDGLNIRTFIDFFPFFKKSALAIPHFDKKQA